MDLVRLNDVSKGKADVGMTWNADDRMSSQGSRKHSIKIGEFDGTNGVQRSCTPMTLCSLKTFHEEKASEAFTHYEVG